MFGECFRYLQSVLKMIFHNSGVVWSENLLKKGKKLRTFEMLQNRFWRLFLSDIFTFPLIFSFLRVRTTLIFLPTHLLMFGECFRYLQSVSKMIFHNSGVVWSENLLKKMEKIQNFRDAPKSVLKTFLSNNFTFPLIFSFLRVVRL